MTYAIREFCISGTLCHLITFYEFPQEAELGKCLPLTPVSAADKIALSAGHLPTFLGDFYFLIICHFLQHYSYLILCDFNIPYRLPIIIATYSLAILSPMNLDFTLL